MHGGQLNIVFNIVVTHTYSLPTNHEEMMNFARFMGFEDSLICDLSA